MGAWRRSSVVVLLLSLVLLFTGCFLDLELFPPAIDVHQRVEWSYEWPDHPTGMGYEQLEEGSGQKLFYDDLYARCMDFLNGGDVSRDVTMEKFRSSDYNDLTFDEMCGVWNVFCVENPQFYWLSHKTSGSTAGNVTTMSLAIVDSYESASARANMDAKLIAFIDACMDRLKNVQSDLEKALVIHDYLVDVMEYAYESDGKTPEDDEWAHSIVGAIDRGKGVCEAYAKAFHLLCQVSGLDSLAVVGYASNDDFKTVFGHAWNMIRINGSWYGVDVTWDDGDAKLLYFGTDADFHAQRHMAFNSSGEGTEYFFDVPELADNRIAMVYLYKDSNLVGLYENIDAALDDMTSSFSDYEVRLYNYLIANIPSLGLTGNESIVPFHVTGTSSPAVKSILFSAPYQQGRPRHVINFDNAYTLNCEVTFRDMEVRARSFSGLYQAKKYGNTQINYIA